MEMKDKILESAQKLVQQRGFNGFSYADVANEVGIRKASLHHHFPSKTDLGLSLINIYSERLTTALVNLDNSSSSIEKKLNNYIDIYRSALEDQRMCLGGMLASEIITLDPVMLPSLHHFFDINTSWLAKTLEEGQAQQLFTLTSPADDQAQLFVSSLQGALLISRAMNNMNLFEQASSSLLKNLMRTG